MPRDPFAALNEPEPAVPEPDVPAEPVLAIPSVLARKPSQAKRNREWEQANKVTGFRGLPLALLSELKAVAADLGVTISELARALLEYGLAALRRGDLVLQPQLKTGRMTLYPENSTTAAGSGKGRTNRR